MKQVITRRTGPDATPRFALNGAGDTTQVAVLDTETGAVEVVFTGLSFSEDEYKKQGAEQEQRHLAHYQKA
jgi:hypothetical protein